MENVMLALAHSECIYFRCTKINRANHGNGIYSVENNANARSPKAIGFSKVMFAIVAVIVIIIFIVFVVGAVAVETIVAVYSLLNCSSLALEKVSI